MAKFKKVHSGQVLKIFVNRKMKEAIVLFDEKPTLLQCFKKGDYDLILGLFFGTMLLIITFYVFVWTGKFVYKDFINLVNAHAHEKMLLRIVNISKQAVPYVTILIFLYIVVIITVKASFLVENGNRSVTGFILLCGLVFSSLAPRLIIGFKTFINNNYYAKVIIGLGKFIFSLVGSIKSYYFLHGKNLTEFNNISDVLKALLEYLVDF